MRAQDRRLGRIEDALRTSSSGAGQLVRICPDDWPAEHRDRYEIACSLGDQAAAATVIFEMTGIEPVFVPGVISVIIDHRPEGAL